MSGPRSARSAALARGSLLLTRFANFNAGYVMRSQHILFKQGDREPWTQMMEHDEEREILWGARSLHGL